MQTFSKSSYVAAVLSPVKVYWTGGSPSAGTLMMVGVLTYPLERQYFGRNVTLVRNGISLLIALAVAIVMGLVFREFHL